MRDLCFSLFNWFVRHIPRSLLRRLLRTLYFQPDITDGIHYQVHPQVFYNPFPDPAEVDLARLKEKRSLPGIDLKVASALELLQKLSTWSGEVGEFLKSRPLTPKQLASWNETYAPCDSGTLYALLRELKPKRYLEVGCGFSSRVSAAALRRNEADGHPCQAAFIEPYPSARLADLKLPGEFIKEQIQRVPLERFQQLAAGDVLFIDTSHVIKVQNDVEYELLHILPSLNPGVIVHIHDIFTPYDYPAEWLLGNGPNRGGNNEQYALECLLSGGANWEVLLPVHLLWREHAAALKALVYSEDRPAAFWIRKAGC